MFKHENLENITNSGLNNHNIRKSEIVRKSKSPLSARHTRCTFSMVKFSKNGTSLCNVRSMEGVTVYDCAQECHLAFLRGGLIMLNKFPVDPAIIERPH